MKAKVPPGLSQRRTIARNASSRARGTWLSQKPVKTASTARSGSAHASRTWRWARSRWATRRSRARSSGPGLPSYSDSSPLRRGAATTSRCPAASSTISPRDRQRVEPAAGDVELGVPGRVVDRAALVAAAAQVPVVVLGGAGLVVGEHLGVGVGAVGRSGVAARGRCGRGRAAGPCGFRGRSPLGQRLVQAEPQEPVVAGLADAVRAELRPALEVVRAAAACARVPHHRQSNVARNGISHAVRAPSRVDRRPRPERRDVARTRPGRRSRRGARCRR